MSRRPRSLQARLLLGVLGAVSLLWVAAALKTWHDSRHELGELLDGHLAQAAALLVVQQAHELGEHGEGTDAPSLHRYAPQVVFQIFHEGRLTQRSARAPLQPMLRQPDAAGFGSVHFDGADWRVFGTRGAEQDVQVFVAERMDVRDALLRALLLGTLQPLALALPLLALAAAYAIRQGLAPLRRLGRLLAAREPQAADALQVDDAPAEMLPMMAALNRLFERTAALMEAERRFTADAAHELRTPIAAIRAQAQVALGEAEPGPRRQALLNTLAGCDRASRLVDQLLTLARLEAGAAPDFAPLDLGALVQRVMAECAPAAIDLGQSIEAEVAGSCAVAGDATLLAVLVRNLVDNAIRYSPRAASVRVQVEARADGGARLRVADTGPGLNDSERRRLGDRFFRALGNEAAGSGLGWSIVSRIAAAHGAAVATGPTSTQGGLTVDITWPGPGSTHPTKQGLD